VAILLIHAAERADRRDDCHPGRGNLPQLHRGAGAGHQVGDHLRPVQDRDLLRDVPGIQHPRARPSASLCRAHRFARAISSAGLWVALRRPESMTASSRSANPTLAPGEPGWANVTGES
jgi:hypothetical protein